MQINTHKHFHKQFKNLNPKQQLRVRQTVKLFAADMASPPQNLRFHALTGEWKGYHSISVGGDLRVHLLIISSQEISLMMVGTHSQLYG